MTEFSHLNHPKQLNLGCGHDQSPEFLNVDLNASHEPDLLCDVTDLGVLPDNYYRYILANDILEHIPRNKCLYTLKEWNRVLRGGGILEVQVPNIVGLLKLFTAPDRQTFEAQEELSRCLYGSQNYNGDYHYNGFTDITIENLLTESGFQIQEKSIRDEWLFIIKAQKVKHIPRDPLIFIEDDSTFIEQAYLDLLGREADEGGKNFYLQQLSQGGLKVEIISSLMASDEYRQRHQD